MNMMKPLVSVCIPVYNSQRWIKQTVESVLNQTYDNIEILIVDDGSTDGSWQIIQKLKEKSLNRIKIFRQENKGACAARNKAFNESRGDFIQWLDADDLLETDKIEKQLKAINFVKRTDILLSGSFAKFYNNSSKRKFIPNNLWRDLYPNEWIITYLNEGLFFYPHCWLVNREIALRAGLWNENLLINQDGEYFTRVVLNSKYIKFVAEAKAYYRTGNLGSISNKKSKRKISSLIQADLSIVENTLKTFDDSVIRKSCINFLQNLYSGILYNDNDINEIKDLKNFIIKLGGDIPLKNFSSGFLFVKKIFGLNIARKLKLFLWYVEIKIRKIFSHF